MRHNSFQTRIFSVIIVTLIVGAVTAIFGGAQQVSSIQARVQVPSGPVSRSSWSPKSRRPPTGDELERTGGTFQRIDRCVEMSMRANGIPGASIAIIDNGSLVYRKATASSTGSRAVM